MARLVALSEGLKGKAYDLTVDRTTVGRVEDNTIQIPEPSVSSHHCEILRQGDQIVIKDLDSTNGTFINGEKITEAPLKPGQTLRLGQIELRLEDESAPAAPAAETAAPAAKPQGSTEHTTVMQRGVQLSELERGPVTGFDTAGAAFSKKSNQVNRYFIIGGAIIGVAILGLIIFLLVTM